MISWSLAQRNVPTLVAGGVLFDEVQLGKEHTFGRTAGGSVYRWGRGDSGQLGNNQSGADASALMPILVDGGSYNQLSVGWFHTCALNAVGGLECWGDNTARTITGASTPLYATPLSLGGSWLEVKTGSYLTCMRSQVVGASRASASTDGGQVGVGDTTLRSAPVDLCF